MPTPRPALPSRPAAPAAAAPAAPAPTGAEAVHARFLAELEAHKKILYKTARLYCENPADRQELMQEIVVQLFRAFPRFDHRSKFATWMYRIALNVAISHSRERRRRTSGATAYASETAVMEATAVEPPPGDKADDISLLNQLLGRLSQLDRALMLLYLEGHDYDSIAEILGLSATNVSTKISRIKQRLRHEFAEQA